MEKCDGDSEVGAVGFYESFLSQGLEILEIAYEVHKSKYLKDKINLFKNMLDDLENVVVIEDCVYETIHDVPIELAQAHPEQFAKLVLREENRRRVNDFLDEVR